MARLTTANFYFYHEIVELAEMHLKMAIQATYLPVVCGELVKIRIIIFSK